MKHLTETQFQLAISTTAKLPVAEARPIFVSKLNELLPKRRLTDAQFVELVNSVLGSFKPGQWAGDSQGVFPTIDETMSLKTAASVYERVIRGVGAWCWPPIPPLTPQQAKAIADTPRQQLAEAYARTLHPSEEAYQRHKREEAERRQAEATADDTPWPLLPAPPSTRVIRGEVVSRDEPPAPTDAELRQALPREPSDDERASEALRLQLERERRERRRRQGPPKVFFH